MLEATLNFPIKNPKRRLDMCPRITAYTFVGASTTWLCPDFKRLPIEHAALVLIHEALHHAGLTEKPHDQGAMTSREINTMVTTACQLLPPVECVPRLPQLHRWFSYPIPFTRTLLRALFHAPATP